MNRWNRSKHLCYEGSVINPDPGKANKIVFFTNAQKVEYQTLVTGKIMTQKIKRVLVDF